MSPYNNRPLDESLRAEADALLYQQGLYALMQKYGQVQVCGSYQLRLMVWRDLDIYLVTPHLTVTTHFVR